MSGQLKDPQWKRKVERLELVSEDLVAASSRLDRLDRDETILSVTQAKESIAKAQEWVADAITCYRVDNGQGLEP